MDPGKVEVSEIEGRFGPEARDAALYHAHGHSAQAEEILTQAIAQPRTDQDSRLLWLMLLELHRLHGRAAAFDLLAARYGATWGKPAPAWSSSEPALTSLPAALRPGGPAYCALPADLSSGAALELIRRATAHQTVLHVDASRVERVTEDGCEAACRELDYALANGNGVHLSGADHLERLLRRLLDASPHASAAWRLLLLVYQLEGREKAFEVAAMEYALALEVEPPRWERVLMPVAAQEAVGERRREPRYEGPEAIFLRGEIVGGKDEQLAAVRRFGQSRSFVNINFEKLYRIDPVGAGSLGNTVLGFNNLGKRVRLIRPNLLVETWLRMLGVDAHVEMQSAHRM